MKKKLKRFFVFCSAFAFVSAFTEKNAGAEIINSRNYAEYTLENGIEIFVLEDFSSAKINLELQARAGISAQSKENTGFFTLYSRLFRYGENENDTIKNLSSECSADSSRYRISVSPSQFEEKLEEIRNHAFFPHFSDSAIEKEYSAMKNEVLVYSETPASFLNSAIDSRVFSSAPWKQDSGIYPSLFAGKTNDEVRSVLKNIAEYWYTTENTSIFISGCIKKEDALESCRKIFASVNPSFRSLKAEPAKAGGKQRKFVLCSPDFSESLTQIVVQFASLNMSQADLAGAAFSENRSSMKKMLLKQRNLSLREAEFINAEAAHKNGSSRLIIQALMEEPANKKVSLAEQAELFVLKMKEGISQTSDDEFISAKKTISENFARISSGSKVFMDYLSQFRAVEDFSTESEKSLSVAERLLSKEKIVHSLNTDEIKKICQNEEPFVFVLLNTKTYRKNRKSFDKEKYVYVDSKNGFWYSDELSKKLEQQKTDEKNKTRTENAMNALNSLLPFYKDEAENTENGNAKNENAENGKNSPGNHSEISAGKKILTNHFIEENRSSIKQIHLENGIPVTVKRTETTGNILIMLSLKLGKFSFKENPGFEKVITQAFANNIQKEILKYRAENILESEPEILSETFNDYTAVTLECAKEDAGISLSCISNALIFGEILPYEADSYVYSVRTQKRLYNASAENQMTYRAMRWLFTKGIIRNVFDTESDVLENTEYREIASAYPSLLDSNLYSIVIVGNIDWEYLLEPLKNTFGLLSPQKDGIRPEKLEKIDFPEKQTVRAKIRHTFTTDIKAEDAGPMPAILVPTTNFSDPAQFWLESPLPEGYSDKISGSGSSSGTSGEDSSETENRTGGTKHNPRKDEIIYDAIMFRFREFLEEKTASEVKLFQRTKEIPSAAFTFMKAKSISEAERLFRESANEFIGKLKEEIKSDAELQEKDVNHQTEAANIEDSPELQEKDESLQNTDRKRRKTDSETKNADSEIRKIKDSWIMNALKGTDGNRGTAILVRNGNENPFQYLDDYTIILNASDEEIISVAEKYLVPEPKLKIFSEDSEK